MSAYSSKTFSSLFIYMAINIATYFQVMVVAEVVAVTAGAGTIIRMMVATTVSMEDSRVMATTSGAVEAAEAMNNADNEPVVKEAEETG